MKTHRLGGIVVMAGLLASVHAHAAPPPPKANTTRPAATSQPMSATAPSSDTSLLTPDEAKQIDAVIDLLVAAGFPDAKGAVVYSGKLTVSATFDPAKDAPPLPSRTSNTQMTIPNTTRTTYGYAFDGLHFKLADGSWIIATALHFTPRAGDTVNVNGATEVNLATLTADAMEAKPFDAETGAGKWLEGALPAEREQTKATLTRLAPITMSLKLRPDDLAPATLFLHRAGWPDARELCLVIAQQRARVYWQLRPWLPPESVFDPTGLYAASVEEEAKWKAAHAHFTSEPPATALRRAMFRLCRAEMVVEGPEDAMFPLDVALACAKASVDPEDPQHLKERMDFLAAGERLPVEVKEDASLVERLQSWEAQPRQPRMIVKGGANAPTISTSFEAPKPSYTPDPQDLDELVKLLADERPSRFNDFSGPRTLGDNAWRALAVLLKADPRGLAGHPTDHPWTTDERKAAAKAVETWWKEHRAEYVPK